MIYFDNAATTIKKPDCVIQAVVNAMQTFGNSSRGSHEGALCASRTIFEARMKIDRFFHGYGAERVVFTANSTEALNIAIRGAIPGHAHVISTDLEHNSVLRPLYYMRDHAGVQIDFVRADADGNLHYDDFEKLIRPQTRAIVCTHASNLTGLILDVERVGRIAKKYDLAFIVDASQTAGAVPIDMKKMKIDLLCFTGHKGLMGPQGTGGLLLSDCVDIEPWKVGGTGVQSYLETQPEELPTKLEAGTLNGHGIAGLSAAIDFIEQTGLDVIHAKEQALMNRFYEEIRRLPQVKIYGDPDKEKTAIIAFNIRGCDSGKISDILSYEYGISARPGAHCAPRLHRALGTVSQGAVRFSFSYFNTEEEIDQAAAAVREICISSCT
ncbi:MAG: aminotransferase class V-fold PLP-dependent enzyme [Lachnospiraceae bacterium]|nr:aminotransferase class V-fold PLP-dependent enzyme [Lachnospiraceae bacterium]